MELGIRKLTHSVQISTNDSDFDTREIARFTAGGSLDTAFGDSGVLIQDWFAGTADIYQDILLQKMANELC